MRRQQLTETQIAALSDPPTDQRELVRHYTLSAGDIALIRRHRGDHSRLGHALMLCYLRHPGRPLRANERPLRRDNQGERRASIWMRKCRRMRDGRRA